MVQLGVFHVMADAVMPAATSCTTRRFAMGHVIGLAAALADCFTNKPCLLCIGLHKSQLKSQQGS
jgi:hypothetical protein